LSYNGATLYSTTLWILIFLYALFLFHMIIAEWRLF
jgi:hypothetical protein